jgi:hypothetical protein
VTFEELRDAGPAAPLAAMEALPVRADNGLYEMACRLLAVEPGLRPSAVGCLTGLTPGRPVTYAGVGAQSAAVLEKPYEVADWITSFDHIVSIVVLVVRRGAMLTRFTNTVPPAFSSSTAMRGSAGTCIKT